MNRKHILISGASIAGPTLAYWLTHYGFEVTVVERSPALRPGGYGVDIRGAAVEVIARMGIIEQVKAADTNMHGTYFVNAKGKVTGKASNSALASEDTDIEIMRDDLSQILYRLTKDNAKYLWGKEITSLSQQEEGVDVTLSDGTSHQFDMVIGADGIHSNVRRLVFGEEKKFIQQLGNYLSIFTLPNYKNIDHMQQFYPSPNRTVGMYSARNNTEAKGIFLFRSSEPLQYDYHDAASQKQIVHTFFDNLEGWETQAILQYMDKAPDFYFDEISQVHMPTWSNGRVALVGDAAYCPSPLSGQGSSLALVGAYVLAGEIKQYADDYKAAFTAYEQQLRPFVEKNQKIGMMSAGGMIDSSNFKIALRNFTLRIPGFMPLMFKMITKMIAKAANAIVLKRYV